MCTCTFWPTRQGYILTFNRDERVSRGLAQPPASLDTPLGRVYRPLDPAGGGTWFALLENGRAAVLMNGGVVGHIPNPPYRHSRGLLPLAALQHSHIMAYVDTYDFSGLEPFTLLGVEPNGHTGAGPGAGLFEVRWTGTELLRAQHPLERPRIYSSSTLYSPEAQARRQGWFEAWQRSSAASQEGLLQFHREAGGEDPWNRLCMNRDGNLRTVSITSAQVQPTAIRARYLDVVRQRGHTFFWPLRAG